MVRVRVSVLVRTGRSKDVLTRKRTFPSPRVALERDLWSFETRV
jgi:hypothetical protein